MTQSINDASRALLETLARDPFNGLSAEALAQAGHTAVTIRRACKAGLISSFTKRYSNPPGLMVTAYRISTMGLTRVQGGKRR